MKNITRPKPSIMVTGSSSTTNSASQSGTSTSGFSRASTILTTPDSPSYLSETLNAKLESIALQRQESETFTSNAASEIPAWDRSGPLPVTNNEQPEIPAWDRSGDVPFTHEDVVFEDHHLLEWRSTFAEETENDSEMLGREYLEAHLTPSDTFKLSYYLENLAEELEHHWQQYLTQYFADHNEMQTSAYLENFKKFIERIELLTGARDTYVPQERPLSVASSNFSDDSFYSACETEEAYSDVIEVYPLSEVTERGRTSTNNFVSGPSTERRFVVADGLRRPQSLEDIINLHPALQSRPTELRRDVNLCKVKVYKPYYTPPNGEGVHVSIETAPDDPQMSGGRSPCLSRCSSRASIARVEATKADFVRTKTFKTSILSKLSIGAKAPKSPTETKEYKKNAKRMDGLIGMDENYVPSLAELKERPARRKRFDKFRRQMKFWRSKEKSEDVLDSPEVEA
ncbi:hypothetical protein HYALB_00001070 [Hymenoscyphus albidus]|uniref:Uncharacterized protein n=1 Tax=Hymenoscyphus albidus TaxID=595503 RepID=A0A9N9LX95_9HELO|nr:hypothetical protein HYALB_00001070 [Hymenoscyphus albidus]